MSAADRARAFMRELGQSSACIDAPAALGTLSEEIEAGLSGGRGLLMLPSLRLPAGGLSPREDCVAIDVGGTTLRCARVSFEGGEPRLADVRQCPVPGLREPLSEDGFFSAIARFAGLGADSPAVCISFSYYMEALPGLDAKLLGWCKELRVSEPSGRTVAELMRRASGNPALKVLVVNDSVATMLGCLGSVPAGSPALGVIVGTGFNICWTDDSGMIYNTEAGDSRAFPQGTADREIDLSSACPGAASAEKLCSGVYLEQIIRLCLAEAEKRGLIGPGYGGLSLAEYSALLLNPGSDDDSLFASELVREAERRSALIVSLCTAALLRRNGSLDARVFIGAEGSVINKMPGYRELFLSGLRGAGVNAHVELRSAELACVRGAAMLSGSGT